MNIVLALRAAVSFAVGIFITFNQSHSATTGLLSLAIFGIGYALLNAIGGSIWGKGLAAIENLPLTIVALIVGALALLVPSTDPLAQQLVFTYLVTGWGLISGAFELYLARRDGFATLAGKDGLLNAGLGLALGLLFLIAPLDIVSAVGFFGAYLVLSGIHLGIAATTPKK
jgi:multisubunit Na+/H+ antiporter MnhC subunit